jgi:hypothetical protein
MIKEIDDVEASGRSAHCDTQNELDVPRMFAPLAESRFRAFQIL